MESLGDAKAKMGGFPVAHPYYPNMGVFLPPPTHTQTHTQPRGGGGVAGNIEGFSARTHLNMEHLFLFTPPLQCKLRL